jgi:hypothetical protein
MIYDELPGINTTPAPAASTPLVGYKDPTGLASFIKAVLIGCIVLTFGLIYFAWNGYEYFQALSRSPAYLSGQSVDIDYSVSGLQALLILGYVVVILTLLVTFLMWVYRTCKNAHALGAANLKYTPGWAVGWFFIPFANIVMPYMVMQEIYKASRHPIQWRKVPGSKMILAWWILGLGSNVMSRSSVNLEITNASLEQLLFFQQLVIGSHVVDIVVSGLLFLIVTEISDYQNAVFRYLSENPDEHPAASQSAEMQQGAPVRPRKTETEATPLCQKT